MIFINKTISIFGAATPDTEALKFAAMVCELHNNHIAAGRPKSGDDM